ncbi:hypothetical protein AT238_01580 [Bartonella henselae]|uniref:hypothetical protein n=1 Tax=Bartonella henselae TaxID=38323 RepID=UPI00095AF1C5|nr:hypothetical protein [Bartonella henselae]OLL52190.1 hypothetical protein AT238_01580 [Bartonella henselae]
MVDFVGILKKAINAQNNVTPQLRKRIYKRALKTLEHQFVATTIPQAIAEEQRKILQSAIATVEAEYLAVEKELLSSVIGWNPKGITEADKHTQTSVLSQGHESSILGMSDAEPVNMKACFASQHADNTTLRVSPLASPLQGDNPHIVSHIFSQALRRANRSSMQRRIVISTAIVTGFFTLIIGICFVGGRVFISNDHQLSGGNVKASHVLPQTLSVKRKLTQRLLEDGSEVDTSLDQTADSSNEEGISTAISSSLQSMEQLGEAVFYQARTDYDTEKVATGSARWTLIKESRVKGVPEESAIQGDITIPDKGLSLRLILRRNTDVSFPAAYIMDLIFILSDKFSGQAISSVQALTFKASEQSVGQALTRTVTAKICDDFFLVALSSKHPFLNRNLQLMRELDWMRLVLTDKNGRTNELTFAKGPIGESIFNKVIGKWLEEPEKLTVLGQKK